MDSLCQNMAQLSLEEEHVIVGGIIVDNHQDVIWRFHINFPCDSPNDGKIYEEIYDLRGLMSTGISIEEIYVILATGKQTAFPYYRSMYMINHIHLSKFTYIKRVELFIKENVDNDLVNFLSSIYNGVYISDGTIYFNMLFDINMISYPTSRDIYCSTCHQLLCLISYEPCCLHNLRNHLYMSPN